MNPNQVVTIQFKLKDDEGNVIDSSYGHEPLAFISGHGHILPKLKAGIATMLLNTKKTIVLSAEDGYGHYDQDKVQSVKRRTFR